DTALVCSLLSIHNALQLQSHPTRGALFENMVVTELVKQRLNAGKAVNLFYWRDKAGHEIDLIIDNAGKLLPIEIKSGKSINSDFFKNIDYWCGLSGVVSSNLLYAGNTGQKRSNGTEVMNWRSYLSL
ncbi:MAG TPA: DUF4143 domain-containing protein, partial [Bacteroidales bacterium]|nr:DUF4143 domain-containing protein [Bacteroidales bacterium]